MRSVRIATWTSGEPVSPLACACFLISASLRSAVIDIGSLLFFLKVEPPDDPKAVGRCFDERHGTSVLCGYAKPRPCGETDKPLPLSEHVGLAAGDGEGRDVVQRRLQRNNRPIELARLSGFLQKVQRNGGLGGEGPGGG